MQSITLNDVIQAENQDPEFAKYFQRETLINEIANLVVALRKQAHLTQRELAQKAGTTQPVIARLESGSDDRIPSLELLARLAAATHTQLKISIESQPSQ
jgi:predicted transcriptional regulator